MESDADFNLYIRRQCTDDSNSIFSQNNSGLLRFSSAPTSLLEGYIDEKATSEADRLSYSSSGLCSPDKAKHMYALENNNNKDVINRFGAVSSHDFPPQYPRPSVDQLGPSMMEKGGYRGASSMSMEHHQVKVGLGNSILMKQNSSPAGWFTNLKSQSGYTTFKATGNSYRDQNNDDLNNRFNEEKVGNNRCSRDPFFNSGFPYASWNDSSNFEDNSMIGGIKREPDFDQKLYSSGIGQNMERNGSQILSHHLSLPTKDTVLCKIRAKRGCATHPRSIAERVRRTRISERMKKLQELVPNMDKQTNTADMLDLAVEYIKDLQRQYKMLSDSRAKCKCSASESLVPNHTL